MNEEEREKTGRNGKRRERTGINAMEREKTQPTNASSPEPTKQPKTQTTNFLLEKKDHSGCF
ncbi:MAG: hypothetical protein ABSF44_06155 [Candidatus Bathyarchaeia archaeon]|jgi:hypothetical protein